MPAMMRENQPGSGGRLALHHDGVVEAPTWFGPSERPLFGWFVAPASGRVRGAVVLCQPMGEEGDKSYRTFRRLSQQLALAGLLALRFDYDGTGDSAGRFDDPGRVGAWIDSVEYAVAEVRRAGVARVSLVGMRLGATIAYAAAVRGLGLEDLLLWDPCVNGRAFLREQQMLHAAWLEVGDADPERWIETPSYRYPVDAAAEMRTLAIDGAVQPSGLAERVTVLVRPDRSPARALSEALSAVGVGWGETIGQDLLLDHSTLDAIVPDEGIADVVSRLTSHATGQWTEPHPSQTLSASWSQAGCVVTETARLTGPDENLFGIESRGAEQDSSLPRVLMINVAAERHIGPGRIWVRLSREIAGEGFLSTRLDQSGVGDSATPVGCRDDELFAERWLEDVPAVSREFSSATGVVGIGVSSSGASVLQASASGALREAICVNVELRVTGSSPITTTSRNWTVFRHMPSLLKRLSIRHARIARTLWDIRNLVAPRGSLLWLPRSIARRGGRVTFLIGRMEEHKIIETRAWRVLWGREFARSQRVHAVVLPNVDHSLRSGKGQDEVIRAIHQQLDGYRWGGRGGSTEI